MYLSSFLASRGHSQLTVPAYPNIVDPGAVDVEDSDSDSLRRELREPTTRTLGSIRTKLARRLSHRVNTRATSRSSGGASDEELARRAELKRLMHKRIREELKSEQNEEDEDDDDPRPAPLKRPNMNKCREPELPGGGPRDTIEFSVSGVGEQDSKKDLGTLPESSVPAAPMIDDSQSLYQQRTSCSGHLTGAADYPYSKHNIIPTNLTPTRFPGGSGRQSPSTDSWHLSDSEIHIESYIEPLVEASHVSRHQSPKPEFPSSVSKEESETTHPNEADTTTSCSNPTMQDETVDTSQTMQFEHDGSLERDCCKDMDTSNYLDETVNGRFSPLDIWLRSQDMHCTSALSGCSNSDMVLDCHESNVDDEESGSQEPKEFISLPRHNNQIANFSMIPQENTLGVKLQPENHGGEKYSIATSSNESFALCQVLNRMEIAFPPGESHVNGQDREVSSRYTSSRYTTRPNSQQATPRGSNLSVAEPPANGKMPQLVSPIYGAVSPYRKAISDNSEVSSYQTALNKTPSSDHTKTQLEGPQSRTAEALSTHASETASFKQREEELKSIKKRFGLASMRRYPMIPVYSKFREEFDDPKSLCSGRNSILSKLYLAFPKKAEGPSEWTNGSEEPAVHSMDAQHPCKMQPCGPAPNRGQHIASKAELNAHMGGKDKGMWQRHRKQESDHRPWGLGGKLIRAAMPIRNTSHTSTLFASKNNGRDDINKISGTDDAGRTPAGGPRTPGSPNDVVISDGASMDHTIDIHAGVLHEWVEQLQAEDMQRHSRAESRVYAPKNQPRRLRTPPESWAKWPSHTREERAGLAGPKDRVNSRDFAVAMKPRASETDAGGTTLSTGRESTAAPRTLSSQVGKALKTSWSKMILHAGSLGRASNRGFAARSTLDTHGFLEYPELELLPTVGGYREMQALDQQIDTMKRRSTSGRRITQQSSSDCARHALASRVAEEVHRVRAESQELACDEIEHAVQTPPTTQFLSPAHSLFARRSKSCDPEVFSAPGSQCTDENCVQPQMLDDENNGSITEDQDRTAIKRARSTGNIEIRLPTSTIPMLQNTRVSGPVQRARKPGLRRHQSLGWLRGRSRGGN
ncbi:hypothetical protein F4777DRAFT_574929 [Nemania sp. FL0916]|nr:hypothetical protein F4777DRAFT_574929 [Nemania sp. FL0916]